MTRARTLSRRHLLLGAAAGLAWLGSRPGRAEAGRYSLASFPPPGTFDYRIVREDDNIGRYVVEFRRDDAGLTVNTRMEATVTLLSVPVFRFRHVAEERWEHDRLVSLSSRTDDDGTDREVELRAEGDRLRVVYNGKTQEYDAPMLPTSLWHPATVEQSVLFDSIKGRPRDVSVADRGRKSVEIGAERIAAHHYSITGQLDREVWYDLDRQVVQVTFHAKDKSLIAIQRRA